MGNKTDTGKYMYRKNEGRKKIKPYKRRVTSFFLPGFSIMSTSIDNPNRINVNPIVSEDVPDMKKVYCVQPAINVRILFNAMDNPAFFPTDLTAITKKIHITMSSASNALYSSLLKNFRNGIIINETPGANSCVVSNTGVLRSAAKYFVTPKPFPARKFLARVICTRASLPIIE